MRPAQCRRRSGRVVVALAVALFAIATSASQPPRAGAVDPARALRDARAAADAAASRVFALDAEVRALDTQVAVLDARIAIATREAAASEQLAAVRAAALYRSAGGATATTATAESSLDAARRAVLLGAATDDAQATIERYTRTLDDLQHMRTAVVAMRAQITRELADARVQRAALDAAVASVQRAYFAARAAARAAALEARRAATVGTGRVAAPPSASSATSSSSSSAGGASTDATTPPTTGSPPPAPTPQPPPPPPQSGVHPHHGDPFLTCVRQRESRGIYTAVSPNGYYGAYQFSPSTWDVTASHAGRFALIGVRPDHASPWDQDDMAWDLYQWQGPAPWGGHCP